MRSHLKKPATSNWQGTAWMVGLFCCLPYFNTKLKNFIKKNIGRCSFQFRVEIAGILSPSPNPPLSQSPPHPLPPSPNPPLTPSPPHPLTPSPPHPLTPSPPHPLTLSPPHPLTLSPPHPLTLSPPHPLFPSPSRLPSFLYSIHFELPSCAGVVIECLAEDLETATGPPAFPKQL